MKQMKDVMSRSLLTLAIFLFLCGSFAVAQQPIAADRVLEDAKTQAAQQHKVIFLVFGASWCQPCHRLDDFLVAPEMRHILEKYFIEARVNVLEDQGKHPELESPGGQELAARLGVTNSKGQVSHVPFIVFLDAAGEPVVNSYRPVEGSAKGVNIGYPAKPEEIDWFGAMLKKAVPTMSAEELHTIDDWLRRASASKKSK